MIRKITKQDQHDYITLATEFYNSSAVLHPIPIKHIKGTFGELVSDSPYVEGYLMEDEEEVIGYALLSKTYSQEAGGMVLWIEELYIRPEHQGKGYGSAFFTFLDQSFQDLAVRLRLEVEMENEKAIVLYERNGFRPLNYAQMYKGK